MSYTYEQRKRPQGQTNTQPARPAAAGPVSAPLRADAAGAGNTAALDAAMQERMTRTFGDLNAVKGYEPPAPSAAPAAAEPYTGPVTHALSDASPSPAAAGPMQAKRRDADAKEVKQMQSEGENYNGLYATPGYANYDNLSVDDWEEKVHKPGFSRIFGKKKQTYKVRKGGLTPDQSKIDRNKDLTFTQDWDEADARIIRPGMDKLWDKLEKKYGNKEKSKDFGFFQTWDSAVSRPANPVIKGVNDGQAPDTPVHIEGLGISRMFQDMKTDRGRGFNMDAEEMEQFFDDLMAPKKKGLSDMEQLDANKRFDKAVLKYKNIVADDMNHTEKTYGRLMTQLHPEDVAPQMGTGKEFDRHVRFQQDADQLVYKGGARYFDFENNEADKHFRDQSDYYTNVAQRQMSHNMMAHNPQFKHYDYIPFVDSEATRRAEELEKNIGGPQMSPKRFRRYVRDVQKRAGTKDYMRGRLFGRYLPGHEVPSAPLKPEGAPVGIEGLDDIPDDAFQIDTRPGDLIAEAGDLGKKKGSSASPASSRARGSS